MFIRCRSCHDTVWMQPTRKAGDTGAAGCKRCGQVYDLGDSRWSRRDDEKLSKKARELAARHAVDMPGAYSVLFGVMTLEEVLELGRGGQVPGTSGTVGESYDPAFHPAVQAGHLTARQALERGKRHAFAALLAHKHHLSKDLALAVTDNRMSLLQALRARNAAPGSPVQLARPRAWITPARLIVAVLLLFALAPLAHFALGKSGIAWQEGRVETVDAVEVRTNVRGEVVELVGHDPGAILEVFCRRGERRFLGVDVVAAASSSGSRIRLGLLRDPETPSRLMAITMTEHEELNAWIAGDGKSPLRPEPAPPGAERAIQRR